jgi:probable rRNA maturation factor
LWVWLALLTMILFDPEQSEAVNGFPGLVAAGAKLPGKATLARYLREAQAAVGLKGEVSVLLTTDDGIRGLNRRFRKKNKATDVLSFPAESGYGVAGDLAVSVETAARQAAEQGHRLSVELRVLMLHGLLHLAGMDHESDAGEMARKERRLRAKLGLPLGLIERAAGEARGNEKVRVRVGTRAAGRAEFRLRRRWQGLKPRDLAVVIGPTEVVPCYKTVEHIGATEVVPFQKGVGAFHELTRLFEIQALQRKRSVAGVGGKPMSQKRDMGHPHSQLKKSASSKLRVDSL